MSDSNGQACPECTAPRQPDGTPSCGCTRRASEALRDARTAEAAAAEDFDPLRIRPYVELEVAATEAPAPPHQAAEETAGAVAPDQTMRLTAVREGAPPPDGAAAAAERSGAGANETARPTADETVRLTAVSGGSGLPGAVRGPEETMRLGAIAGGADGPPSTPSDGGRPRRRRRSVLLVTAGAVATVAAAAGFASGLFSYNTPEREGALPESTRVGLPEQSSSAEVSAPASSASAAAPSVSATPSPSTSPSPSASPTSASPSPSASATPSRSAATAGPTVSASADDADGGSQNDAQVLKSGDRGPEVTGLQLRLRQLNLYWGPANGHYDYRVENAVRSYQFARGISQDGYGVYGQATRAKLESETTEP